MSLMKQPVFTFLGVCMLSMLYLVACSDDIVPVPQNGSDVGDDSPTFSEIAPEVTNLSSAICYWLRNC